MSVGAVEVVVTAEDPGWLADLTRELVDRRLVACGHNIAPIRAIYRWDGVVHDESQARVALHTRAALVPAVTSYTKSRHADQVPCVIALPIVGGNVDYVEWIYQETDTAVATDPG